MGTQKKGEQDQADRTVIPSVAGSETKDCVQAAQMLSELTQQRESKMNPPLVPRHRESSVSTGVVGMSSTDGFWHRLGSGSQYLSVALGPIVPIWLQAAGSWVLSRLINPSFLDHQSIDGGKKDIVSRAPARVQHPAHPPHVTHNATVSWVEDSNRGMGLSSSSSRYIGNHR